MAGLKFLGLCVVGVSILAWSAEPTWAQVGPIATKAPALFNAEGHAPEVNSIPVLANIVKSGAKLYYLG